MKKHLLIIAFLPLSLLSLVAQERKSLPVDSYVESKKEIEEEQAAEEDRAEQLKQAEKLGSLITTNTESTNNNGEAGDDCNYEGTCQEQCSQSGNADCVLECEEKSCIDECNGVVQCVLDCDARSCEEKCFGDDACLLSCNQEECEDECNGDKVCIADCRDETCDLFPESCKCKENKVEEADECVAEKRELAKKKNAEMNEHIGNLSLGSAVLAWQEWQDLLDELDECHEDWSEAFNSNCN